MSAVLNTVTASLQRLEGQAGHTGTSFGKIAGGMAVGTVAANAFMGAVNAVTGTLAGMGKGALDLASRLEQAKIGFTTMLGGAQQADAFIRKLQSFAESTSFSFPGIQQVAQSFLAMGFEAKNVIPVITDVSNALAAAGKGGDTEALQRVGMSLSEIAAQGKVTAEQLRELARNGIAVMPMLASAFNKTTAEIRKMAEEGEISATMFFEAFHSETARRYGDIQAEQAKTWAVAISNVGDIIGRMTTETLAEFFGALTKGALLLQDFLKSERVAAWADDMKQAIHAVITALEPLGAALQAALGLGGGAATAPKLGPILGPSPAEVAKAMTVSPEAVKSAKDYTAQIKEATASIHEITGELTGLTAQQDALKIKIQDTTKQYELQLVGLRDQLEANNAAIDETKTKWEGVIAPLERTQDNLKRLAEDTKANFASIMDPLKAQLDQVNRKIQDTKQAFEATVRPLQAQISAIDKANAALTRQRNLVNEIADLATRQKALNALGDPNLRADLAGKLKLNELNRNELEWQKNLIELKTKKGDVEKATRGVDKELDANTRERIKLEQQLQGAANKGLLAQVASEEELNKAKRDQTAIDLANAKIAADAEKAPLEDQLEKLKAQLATTLDPLEALSNSLSRAIEDTATAEAAALAPIIAAQASVARQIEDANQAMKDALAPLEAASKAIATQITEVDAAQRTALEPLKEQQTALERQRDVLELRKKQISDNIAGWKDEAAAIKVAGEEAAKVAKALDLSGGEESSAAPGDRTGTSPLAQFPRPEPATVTAFKELAQNVQASADAFNNLNVATSGGLTGSLVELGRVIGTFVVAGVVVGWLGKLAGTLRGIRSPAGLAQLGLTGVLLVLQRFPEISGWVKVADDALKGFFGELHNLTDQIGAWWAERHQSDQDNAERTKSFWAAKDAERTQSWNAFWTGLLSAPADFWAALGPKTAEEQAADKAAWDAWHAERTLAWNTFWADLPGVVTTELDKVGPALNAQLAAWKLDWEAWETSRTAAWNAFWTDLKTKAEAAWKVFTDWLKPAVDAVVGWIDPIAAAFEGISNAIRNLPATLPDWWTQRPGWLGGTGGLQQTSFTGPGAGLTGNTDKDAMVAAAAARFGVDPGIFARMIKQESGDSLDLGLTSSAGARGPGQFMPGTGNEAASMLGVSQEEFWGSAELQIQGAAAELAKYLQLFGSYRNALIAYNAGPGSDFNNLYEETQRYLDAILGSQTAMNSYLLNLDKVSSAQMNLIPAAQQVGSRIPPAMVDGMLSAMPVVVGAATVVNGQLISALAPPVEAVAAVGSGVVNGLAVVLRDGVPTVVDASTVMGTEIIQALAPVPQAAGQIGEQIPATMAEGIRDGTGEVVDSIENMVDKAMDAFGAGDFQGVRDAFNLKLPPLLGRASGGPMTAGRPYLVGERGPELVIPGRNSWVIPNGSMGGSGGGNSGPITLNFYGDRNPQETARLVRDELIKINRNNAGRVL